MEIQSALGSDIAMCLDECTPYPATYAYARSSHELTRDWARRCRRAHTAVGQALFGIIQGSVYKSLRRESAEALMHIGFDGYALGGLSVGERSEDRRAIIAFTLPLLPREAPLPDGSGHP